MAPFNRRQIGYIQAIAGRQQHRTLICGSDGYQISSATVPTADKRPQTLHADKVVGQGQNGTQADAKSLLLYNWYLDHVEAVYTAIAAHNDNKLQVADISSMQHTGYGMGEFQALYCFDAPLAGTYDPQNTVGANENITNLMGDPTAEGKLVRNPELIPSTVRATPDGFLNSTNLKFRFTLPSNLESFDLDLHDATRHAVHPMGQDHFEYRWIVWRSKRPTLQYRSNYDDDHSNLDAIRDGVSFRNPGYDLFMGQTGRKRGFLGYTLNNDLDKDKTQTEGEAYSGTVWNGSSWSTSGCTHTALKPTAERNFTVDDLLTARLNKDDYVIMKDVRFFLGKEHGKSHFEDTLHWDWNDPIDTAEDNVLSSTTLNDKNYRWHMTLIGTSGGKNPCALNVSYQWTTKMESG